MMLRASARDRSENPFCSLRQSSIRKKIEADSTCHCASCGRPQNKKQRQENLSAALFQQTKLFSILVSREQTIVLCLAYRHRRTQCSLPCPFRVLGS